MSELTKQQLTVENNSSFPNNNTGFITPTLLRTFNGNIIDSMVDEVTYNADSASWTSDITQLEQFSASLNTNFVTPTQLSASSSTLQNNINTKLNTSSFNAYTASQSGVATGSLLLTASAVSNVITFTKGDGTTFPVTVGSVIDSSSLVSTSSFNAYTQSAASGVSASINAATSSLSSSLSSSIGALSSSVAVTNLAQSQSIAQLLGFSSSLDTTFATDAQLSASASTLQNNINTRLLTSSFQTYTSSVSTQISALGTNKVNYSSPVNPQAITGSLIISGTSTNGGGETLKLYGDGIALHVYSGSVEITTPQGNGAHFYSNAPITSSNLRINGEAVIKDLFVSGTWGGTGSGSLFVENSITASVISASTIIANSASFQYVQTVFETASIIYSSGSNQFGDELSDVQTLSGSVKIQGGLTINGSPVQTSSFDASGYLLTSSFNTYTQSAASNTSASINTATSSLSQSLSSSIGALSASVAAINAAQLSTASFNTYTASAETNVSGAINVATQSLSSSIAVTTNNNTLLTNQKLDSSSFNTYTASAATNVSGAINTATGSSLITASISGDTITFTKGNGSTFPIVVPTGSGAGDRNGLITTGSSAVTQSITGSLIVTSNITASGEVRTTVVRATNGEFNGDVFINGTGDLIFNNGASNNIQGVSNITASSAISSDRVITNLITASIVSSSQFIGNLTGTSSFATTASFALNAGGAVDTGSFATTGSNIFIGNQTISGSLNVSGAANFTGGDFKVTDQGRNGEFDVDAFKVKTQSSAQFTGSFFMSGSTFNGKIEAPALSIGVTTLDVLFESTASTTASSVVSEIDFTRIGAGPTGDSTGVRLQTLSGSDTTGDTLLSRVTTNINRHTTTAMTGSVVNTIVQSTWATGSAGTRISYSSTITANAQSASSTLTLNAGNAAANYAGGTASLQAGRVNIGTTGATITSTGSWTQQGSIVTSGGITVNNLGITATSGSINGEFRVNGSMNITGSAPTIQSGSLSGSLVSTLTDTYASTPQGNFIVTLDSASMATLLAGAGTNANTIYFVI